MLRGNTLQKTIKFIFETETLCKILLIATELEMDKFKSLTEDVMENMHT